MAHRVLRIIYKLVHEGLEYDHSICAKIEAENRKNRFRRLEANAKKPGYRLLRIAPTCVQNEALATSLPDEGFARSFNALNPCGAPGLSVNMPRRGWNHPRPGLEQTRGPGRRHGRPSVPLPLAMKVHSPLHPLIHPCPPDPLFKRGFDCLVEFRRVRLSFGVEPGRESSFAVDHEFGEVPFHRSGER